MSEDKEPRDRVLVDDQPFSNADETISAIRASYQQVRDQKRSPLSVLNLCLSRIEKLNPLLNAFITVLPEQARNQAEAAQQEVRAGKGNGPIHGLPLAIKDFFDTAGVRTTAAFEHFLQRVPKNDAAVVTKLKEAGAVLIGKTNMHRLGMGTTGIESAFGPVCNPWNTNYIPGGSSAGSAVAVASGMCYATVDTDAIGSCRLPASCCGVVGFKGSYGLISPAGILVGEEDPGEMIRLFNHVGITTSSVADTAHVLDVLAERAEVNHPTYASSIMAVRDLRIGVATNYEADDEIRELFEAAVEVTRSFGFKTKPVLAPLRHPFDDLSRINADRESITADLFRDIDVLLLPTVTATVPTVQEARPNAGALSSANTGFANYYGLPALSVPCGFDRNGLPAGLQIVGRRWDEGSVLHAGYLYETATSWRNHSPAL